MSAMPFHECPRCLRLYHVLVHADLYAGRQPELMDLVCQEMCPDCWREKSEDQRAAWKPGLQPPRTDP
jgi:hypothetical protein